MLGFWLFVDGVLCVEFYIGKKGRYRFFLVIYMRDLEDKFFQIIFGRIELEIKWVKLFLMFCINIIVIDC